MVLRNSRIPISRKQSFYLFIYFLLYLGQISAQRCILEVKKYKAKYAKGVDAYVEEACIRRELSDNFCYYNPNYDNLNGNFSIAYYLQICLCFYPLSLGAANWARETLNVHK